MRAMRLGKSRFMPLTRTCVSSAYWIMLTPSPTHTRARVAVSATFAMVGGGGGSKLQNDPCLTRKLGKLEGRAIRRSKALSEPIRSHLGHFFRSGDYWGQQRSSNVKFSKNSGFIRNDCHYLGNYNSYAKSKKAIDSSWNALSLRWRQISPKINCLSVRGHERPTTALLSETVFRR